MTIPFHPLADIFPMLEPDKAAVLQADIAANGLRERIVILDGKILDGRNRYCALVAAGLVEEGLPPADGSLWISHFRRFVAVPDGEPLTYVLSKNLHRRHLNESQRAMVAAEIARLGQGRPQGSKNKPANLPPVPTQPEAAKALHVSERSVRSAVKVREHGAPELVEKVKAGEVTVSAAETIASLPVSRQLEILQQTPPRKIQASARRGAGSKQQPRPAARWS